MYALRPSTLWWWKWFFDQTGFDQRYQWNENDKTRMEIILNIVGESNIDINSKWKLRIRKVLFIKIPSSFIQEVTDSLSLCLSFDWRNYWFRITCIHFKIGSAESRTSLDTTIQSNEKKTSARYFYLQRSIYFDHFKNVNKSCVTIKRMRRKTIKMKQITDVVHLLKISRLICYIGSVILIKSNGHGEWNEKSNSFSILSSQSWLLTSDWDKYIHV